MDNKERMIRETVSPSVGVTYRVVVIKIAAESKKLWNPSCGNKTQTVAESLIVKFRLQT